MTKPSVSSVKVNRYSEGNAQKNDDLVAVEEPLEIRLGFGEAPDRIQRSVSVTMRTPGNDFELAAGFLFTEGIITHYNEIEDIHFCEDTGKQEEKENVVRVELRDGLRPDLSSLERNFYTNSSCGVCGKTSIESLEVKGCQIIGKDNLRVDKNIIINLPDKLRESQSVFEYTGGLHACGLFTAEGELILMREDIGRHNALDKLIGAMLYQNKIPLSENILLLSGRAGFELVQKSAMAGIPCMASVGAPSSLAVELADRFNISLIGFLKKDYFNVYTGGGRITI